MTGPKPDLLVMSSSVDSRTRAKMEAAYTVHDWVAAPDRGGLVTGLAGSLRALVTDGHAGADAALMDALPKLALIACYGVGYDGIDVPAASSRSISVINTPGVLTEDVADMALGLLLCSARRLVEAHRFVQDGAWGSRTFPLSTSLGGKTVGILGLGRIGKAIARRLEACGMHVAYTGRRRQEGVAYRYVASLVELATLADVLVVATPGGVETERLVTAEVLEALGAQGTLVNIGRGSTIDEAALAAAVATGRIGAVALDVLEHEPHVPDALLRSDRVLITPHIASGTVETRAAMGDVVLANLEALFDGRELLTLVS